MPALRIHADFHNLDDSNRLRLTCVGTRQDLARHGIEFEEGSRLTFYMDDAKDNGQPDDLLADGVTHFDQMQQCWVAAVDWATLRHASEEDLPSVDTNKDFAAPTIRAIQDGQTSHST